MKELPSAYIARDVEKKWPELWDKSGVFHANPRSSKPPFCVMQPPPNVTGKLHMGHALDTTLQDILVRWKKMSGFETLWMPGTDHAGISTQSVVERHLLKTTGKHRMEFSARRVPPTTSGIGKKKASLQSSVKYEQLEPPATGSGCGLAWTSSAQKLSAICSKSCLTMG